MEVTPGKIAVTNQRIILETTSSWGLKKDYQSFSYANIMEVELKKGILSSNVIIQSRFKGQLHIEALKHNQAQEIEQVVNQKIVEYGYPFGEGQKRYNDEGNNQNIGSEQKK